MAIGLRFCVSRKKILATSLSVKLSPGCKCGETKFPVSSRSRIIPMPIRRTVRQPWLRSVSRQRASCLVQPDHIMSQ